MTATLVINVEFKDESDFEFYRHRLVGMVEDAVIEIVEGTHESLPQSDDRIDVSWEVTD